jgi:hypothetical protein
MKKKLGRLVRLDWKKQLRSSLFRVSLRKEVNVHSFNHDLLVWYLIKLTEENNITRKTRLNIMRQDNRRVHDEIRNEEMGEK